MYVFTAGKILDRSSRTGRQIERRQLLPDRWVGGRIGLALTESELEKVLRWQDGKIIDVLYGDLHDRQTQSLAKA